MEAESLKKASQVTQNNHIAITFYPLGSALC